MKKLMKLLALALAVVMLLPSAALAAEQTEPKELWMQWLNWEEDPEPDSEIHRNSPFNAIPPEEYHMALYTSENNGEKLTPVPVDKLEASAGVTIQPLCPGVKGKEHYAIVSVADWNKEYTISYEGYTMELDSRLPDIGLYSKPEAAVDNYLTTWNYSPVIENRTAYLIFTCADETHGRHLVSAALSKNEPDSDSFKLEKVSDNVYKVSLTGGIDAEVRRLRVDVTWQNVKFMGGNIYTEGWGSDAWPMASILVSEKPVPEYTNEDPTFYNDVKGDFTNKLTLKTGESKTVYLVCTYFNENQDAWAMGNMPTRGMLPSGSDLKLAHDSKDWFKMAVSCDAVGTYTFNSYYVVVDAVYHENGKQYTAEEFQKWDEETVYANQDGKLVIITDEDKWYENGGGSASFEEAFPGQKIDYHMVPYDDYWYPVTVTVEADKLPFTDVKAGEWYEAAVRFVNSKGYMTGDTATLFNPEGKITGAEFAQILYNKEGKPAAAEGASFQGVTDQWYAPAVLWAAGKGILTDTGDAAIDPEKPLTRQQIALMLYNAMNKPEGTADLSSFTDADQISTWAKAAMEWAVSAKVFKGSDGKLTPADSAIRAEVAQILLNYFG